MAAPAMLSSPRLMSYGSSTSISSATAFTPFTRAAALSAATFCAKLGTCPVRVTTPAFAVTPIFTASTLGSQPSRPSRILGALCLVTSCIPFDEGSGLGPRAANRPGFRPAIRVSTFYCGHSSWDVDDRFVGSHRLREHGIRSLRRRCADADRLPAKSGCRREPGLVGCSQAQVGRRHDSSRRVRRRGCHFPFGASAVSTDLVPACRFW